MRFLEILALGFGFYNWSCSDFGFRSHKALDISGFVDLLRSQASCEIFPREQPTFVLSLLQNFNKLVHLKLRISFYKRTKRDCVLFRLVHDSA